MTAVLIELGHDADAELYWVGTYKAQIGYEPRKSYEQIPYAPGGQLVACQTAINMAQAIYRSLQFLRMDPDTKGMTFLTTCNLKDAAKAADEEHRKQTGIMTLKEADEQGLLSNPGT